MSTTNTTASTTTQQLIDQRLDAIDRALLGLLPRNERLGLVAQIESQVREAAAANPGFENQLPLAADDENNSEGPHSGSGTGPQLFAPHRSGAAQAGKKRSQLAISAGVLGIVAISLLFLTPITYAIVGTIGEALNEIALYTILGGHVAAVALAGIAAVALGLAALVRFRKLGAGFTGHAWAITGLCTGALPMFVGGLIGLVTGLQLLTVQSSYCSPVTGAAESTDGPVAYMPPGADGIHPSGYPTPHMAIPPGPMTDPTPAYARSYDGLPSAGRTMNASSDEPGHAFVRQAGDEVPAEKKRQPEDDGDDDAAANPQPTNQPQPAPQAGPNAPAPAGQPSPAEPRPSPEGLQRQ